MEKKIKLKDIQEILKDKDIHFALEFLRNTQKDQGVSLKKLIDKYEKRKGLAKKEQERYIKMCNYEKNAYLQGKAFIAGVDEAGRGPLAGPVVAAAVILPENIFIEKLNDSKKLSPGQRDILYDEIKEKAVAIGVGIVDEKCIDDINILNATKKAMTIAIGELKPQPDFLLIDAVKLQNISIEQLAINKGDSLSISIAAASIIAKVTRDRMIDEMEKLYPQYGFEKHKGYGTEQHINAIKKYGICPIHRVSFTKKFISF